MESLSIYNAKVLLKNFVFPAQFFITLYWTLWTLSISQSVLLFSAFIFGPEYRHDPAWIEMESILYNLTPRRKYHFPQQNFFLPVKNHNNYHYVNKSSFMDFGEGFLYLCGFFFLCGFRILYFYTYNHKALISSKQNSSHFLHIKWPSLTYLIQCLW